MQTLWMGIRRGPDVTRVLVHDGPRSRSSKRGFDAREKSTKDRRRISAVERRDEAPPATLV